ncbi:MAG TPA: hypothetical protein VNM47_13530 [Terriglobia bacterium]|nr:hypothetical protein [Terriglobia bacterium]
MNIRNHTTLVGVFPVISSLGPAWRSSFSLHSTEFAGRFTLPFEAAWGEMVLPEGDYALFYGTMGKGLQCVEILGATQGAPQGIFLVREQSTASVVQNAFICIYKRGRRIIRALELPAIGKSVSFACPTGRKLTDNAGSSSGTQVAGAPV